MAIAHFSIDGEWLTHHVRDLVIEGRWDRAIKILVDDIPGFGHNRAVQLLRGEMKLTGRDDLDFVEDLDTTEYRKALAYQFSGVFTDQYGQYLRPYAVVTSWCKHDLADTCDIPQTRGSEISPVRNRSRGLGRNALVYADDPRTDVVRMARVRTGQISEQRGVPLGDHEAVICRKIENFPHLLVDSRPLNDIEGALVDLYATGITLRETGAHVVFYDDAPVEDASLEAARARYQADPEKMAILETVTQRTREKSLTEYRAAILSQAGDDLFELTYENRDGKHKVMVPTAPFENWALWRTAGAKLAKPWTKICPSGMKMMNDDPYHTDWMVGAGLDLKAMYEDGSNLSDMAYARQFRLQEEIMSFSAAVLCGEGDVYGEVVHPKPNEEVDPDKIAVIPVANARYLAAAVSARAVIVERGGAMAHLVTVAREKGVLIMRAEDAMTQYPEGTKLLMEPEKGRITISRETVRDAFGDIDGD